jgi:hypothetical protein
MARTRRVARSAASRLPKPIVSSTSAVRCSRSYGASSASVVRKKPAKATGCAACMSSARGPESATTLSRWTRRSIESSSKYPICLQYGP